MTEAAGPRAVSWSELRFASPLVKVMTVTCDLRRSGPSLTYYVDRTWVGLPLSGLFTVHARDDEHLVHQALGVVFPQGLEYRMGHPTDDGDTAVTLGFDTGIVEEALSTTLERVRVTRLDVRLRYTLGLLLAAARRGDDALLVDVLALDLLRSITAGLAPERQCSTSPAARAKVDRVRALLAERPEDHWTLQSVARLVDYSPFHLARQFRVHTGVSVHRYLTDLRVAAVLGRIEAGDPSVATIAADLGFSHHSHLTATLRGRLGLTPRAIRERLGRPRRDH
ncbi:MAG: helix-turn-helix transcriptional regulator [Chloroflexi bacterium]|nr:MAG: helix-turn-helix transcriptional regulator [Chloroflexota bacterium]TMG34926.1 MAG: helix-turn-helix transcriptional regulator [Chloroflexota bacterium]